jgi:peptidyl-prolyl cis-trans isomerase A (cyclophilin A)
MPSLRCFAFAPALLVVVAGCLDRPPGLPDASSEPAPVAGSPDAGGSTAAAAFDDEYDRAKARADSARQTEEPTAPVAPSPDTSVAQPADGKDPLGGKFTLADATAGLPGEGPLVATIKTTKGDIRCKLLESQAPNTVANFVGLARGLRPYKSPLDGRWVKQPIYDGTSFHRVIKGFMIQGGDPLGTGAGEPGYVIPDEIWPGARHDHAGQLCMANRGKNTNGAQFFITDASVPHLDGNYTIFGECSPTSVVRDISSTPKGEDDKPTTRVTIKKVEISRQPSAKGS